MRTILKPFFDDYLRRVMRPGEAMHGGYEAPVVEQLVRNGLVSVAHPAGEPPVQADPGPAPVSVVNSQSLGGTVTPQSVPGIVTPPTAPVPTRRTILRS